MDFLKSLIAVIATMMLLTACGGGSSTTTPAPSIPVQPTPPASAPAPGTVIKTIAYPVGISWIGDITYDKASRSLWMTAGNSVTLASFIHMDLNGNILSQVPNANFFINHGSEITFDGTSLWITAFGTSNGVRESKVFNVDLQGKAIATIACPATQSGGYCEGIAWDNAAQTLWSLASDNKNLTQYMRNGTVVAQYPNVLPTIAANSLGIHILFDTATNRLILLTNRNITPVDAVTGQPSASSSGSVLSSSGWDGSGFWQADNSTLTMSLLVSGL